MLDLESVLLDPLISNILQVCVESFGQTFFNCCNFFYECFLIGCLQLLGDFTDFCVDSRFENGACFLLEFLRKFLTLEKSINIFFDVILNFWCFFFSNNLFFSYFFFRNNFIFGYFFLVNNLLTVFDFVRNCFGRCCLSIDYISNLLKSPLVTTFSISCKLLPTDIFD
jgi:hypothetical protein